MMKRFRRFASYFLIIYCFIGLIYTVSGYAYRSWIGKEEVFSPLIAVPMDVIFWPSMLYADIKNRGFLPPDIATCVAIAFSIVFSLLACGTIKKDDEKI